MPATTLVIGRNSFFAQRFVLLAGSSAVRHVGIADLDRPGLYDGVDTVINFAFDPRLYREPYAPAFDVDRRIAEAIAGRPIRYLLTSSRTVYGPSAKWNAAEDAETVGDGIYGSNRFAIERSVAETLGPKRLAILRISNAVAYELQPGRRTTFRSQLLRSLRDHGEVRFDTNPVSRRDFITDAFLCQAIHRLIETGATGIFNIGCGFPVRIGDIAAWIIEGFGRGRLVVESEEVRDEFYLNTEKLRQVTGLAISPEALRDRCLEIGRSLAGG
jgi:dTDP-4-dehydrorhamnose reductase/UDP-glucose 4-epimerase